MPAKGRRHCHINFTDMSEPQSSCTSKGNYSKIAIIPGNGCVNIRHCNWYGWLESKLHEAMPDRSFTDVICEDMPDPFDAKRDVWLRHMKEEFHIDEHTLAIGHSSGAEALMRYAETERVGAIVLVSACFTDLGDDNERASGYYPITATLGEGDGGSTTVSNPWDFAAMRVNCPVFHQFHSDNDPFIPVHEAQRVKDGLRLTEGEEFRLLKGRSHFFDAPFHELLDLVCEMT